ncbi:MAG TPA: hypothetical protein PKI94_02195 [Candidatus Gastranaerophilaceae bacterium]|nr:hypothetical protein [Candidatus Gastranaerophilaceae bacterium]
MSYKNLNANSLLTGIYAGLTNTYSILAQSNPNGVTLDSISKSYSNTSNGYSINPSFASYLQTNFSTLDKDKDGILSSSEFSNFTNQLSTQGLTQAQLTQLGTATGLSSEALSEVLSHFAQVDANKDGKVTSAEISSYQVTSAKEKKMEEFTNRSAGNMSVFYGDDSASAADSSSLLDYRYMSDDETT